jgi:Ca-activated chloride channel homolog
MRSKKGEAFRYTWALSKVVVVLIVLSLAKTWLFQAQEAPTQPPQTPQSAPPPQAESKSEAQPTEKKAGPSSLKIEVDLVLVNATVTDPSNRFVTGLEREHFQVFEDKIEQKISHFSNEDLPTSIGLLFDVSSSMSDKISRAKDAAIAFLKTSNPDDEFFLETFADRPKVDEEFTSDVSEIQNRLAYKVAKGSTTLYDAVYLALEKMKQGHNPKKAILLITDGEDTRSRYSLVNVRNAVKESDVQIYAIGIVSSYYSDFAQGRSGRSVLEEMTEITGGKAYFPNSVYELEDICTKIAIELKNQYILGYSSTNPSKDGRWRKIKVKLNAPKGLPTLSVRTKSGYFAPTG